MSWDLNDDTPRLCAAYGRCVSIGGDVTAFIGEWARQLNVQRPAIWRRLRSGGALPPYQPGQKRGRPNKRRMNTVIPEGPLPPVVRRDPCLRCGARGDLGCKHNTTRSLSGVVFG